MVANKWPDGGDKNKKESSVMKTTLYIYLQRCQCQRERKKEQEEKEIEGKYIITNQ